MSSSRNYLRELQNEASKNGYVFERTRSNHIRLTHPKVKQPIFASGTPSDHRVIANVVAKMKRYLRDSEKTS